MTLGCRILAGVLNLPVSSVQHLVDEGDPDITEALERELGHVWFSFDPSPTIDDIDNEIQAYAYVTGEWPELIILDNLKDVPNDSGTGDDHKHWGVVIDRCQQNARETGAHFMVLHHTKGFYENGDVPIPLGGLLGNMGKTPRLVLTLFQDQPGITNICVVKNSTGMADASGNLRVPVAWLPERSFFGE